MRLGCIVLAYNLPGQLALLLETMRHPQVRLYLRVDKRKPLAPFSAALGGLDVMWLPRHPSRWGSAECVDAALEGLRAALADQCESGYFILISGQDFPLRPVDEIVRCFETNRGRTYTDYWPVAESRHRYRGRDRTDFYTYTVRNRRETCIPWGEDTSHFGLKGALLNDLLRLPCSSHVAASRLTSSPTRGQPGGT